MNASYEWLRAFVPVDASPAELRDLLTTHTATVEDVVPLRADLAPIIVARVVEARPHPDSDHLWVTQVDAGGPELLEVVCGAPNVAAGKLYPFAPVGTTMPNGITLDRRKIRGIVSNGMLCSARELGLGEDHAGIMELSVNAAPGTPFTRAMPVGDTRLVLDVGANRPDLLSHLGIARELSAITGLAWTLPAIPDFAEPRIEVRQAAAAGEVGGIAVKVDANTGTRRYMGAVIRGVRVGPSPAWLVSRLAAAEVRSINNVVDATNYVLHELGQPVHAFDARRIGGAAVHVRLARGSEQLTTLDGATRALAPDTVVIADGTRGQAVAGVMGGRDSEVSDDTTDLFVEVASFDPKRVRAARRALGLSTDASYRFERGVDAALGPMAMDRVLRLIVTLAGGRIDGVLDIAAPHDPQPVLSVRTGRIAQVLGESVPLEAAAGYLAGAGFEILARDAGQLSVRVPTWRADVSGEVDLIEEVARFHGYDRFPDEIRPYRPTNTVDDPLWTLAATVRNRLVGLGLYEIWPIPFVAGSDDSRLRLQNPLAENEGFLRRSLLETLARRAEYNVAQRTGDVRLFEIGSVTLPEAGSVREELRAGILVMGRRRPPHFTEPQPPVFDEWDAKAIAEAAAIAGGARDVALRPADHGRDVLWHVIADGATIGAVARLALDAPVWAAPAYGIEIRLGEIPTAPAAPRGQHAYHMDGRATAARAVKRYRPVPVTPPAEFDLALLVPDDVAAERVESVIRAAAGDLLERLDLFDQYVGPGIEPGTRSLAWRLTFRHPERTLRDKEIEGRRGKILGALDHQLHVRQRSI